MKKISRFSRFTALLLALLTLSGCTVPKAFQMKDVDYSFFEQKIAQVKGLFTGVSAEPTPEPTAEPTPSPTPRPEGAQGAVLNLMEALVNDNRAMVQALCGDTLPGYRGDTTIASDALYSLYRTVYSNLTWHFGAVSEGNASATVELEVTAPDMRRVLQLFTEQSASMASLPYGERQPGADQLLLSLLQDAPATTATRKVKASLYKEEGAWAVKVTSDLAAALTGALTIALQDFALPEFDDGFLLENDDSTRSQYLIGNDYGAAVLKEIHPNAPEGFTLVVECSNYTSTPLVFAPDESVVNGFSIPCSGNITVPGHGTATGEFVWSRAAMELCGITAVNGLDMILRVYEKPAWPVYTVCYSNVSVNVSGKSNKALPLPVTETEFPLIDSESAFFAILSAQSDGPWGYTLTVALENRAGETLWYSFGEEHVNGRPADPGWSTTVPAGMRAVETVHFPAGTLMAQDVSEAGSIELFYCVSSLMGLDVRDNSLTQSGHVTLNNAGQPAA